MNFGKWIVVAFIAFAMFIATLVAVCVREDVSLVSKTYYQEELKHQDKIDKIKNTQELAALPEISIAAGSVRIDYADLPNVTGGTLMLVRPSNAGMDQSFELQPTNANAQQFELKDWTKGLYRVTLQWSMNGKDFFVDKLIVL